MCLAVVFVDVDAHRRYEYEGSDTRVMSYRRRSRGAARMFMSNKNGEGQC